jgi:ribokinase
MGRVVVLGASLMDMNLRLDRLPTPGQTRLGGGFFLMPGGKGANQAVAARRAGAEVVFLTAFGSDDFGRQIRDRYFDEGIDLEHARFFDTEPSGVALILVGDDGENLIGVAMGANARLTVEWVDDLPAEVFDPPGVLLVSLEVPMDTAIRAIERARAAGMTVVLNPAPADVALIERDVLRLVDVLTPNVAEIVELSGRAAQGGWEAAWRASDALLDRGLKCVVATLGADGCMIYPRPDTAKPGDRGNPERIPAFEVKAVDTVGAGDAFNGALAAALAEGLPLIDAATRATAAAAIAVTRPGAQGALPWRAEIDRMVASQPPP